MRGAGLRRSAHTTSALGAGDRWREHPTYLELRLNRVHALPEAATCQSRGSVDTDSEDSRRHHKPVVEQLRSWWQWKRVGGRCFSSPSSGVGRIERMACVPFSFRSHSPKFCLDAFDGPNQISLPMFRILCPSYAAQIVFNKAKFSQPHCCT